MQDCQPEILIGSILSTEIKFKRLTETVQGIGAGIHFPAFDPLDGACADLTAFRQLLLCQSFLLAQFRDFESELWLVHGLLLSNVLPILGVAPGNTTSC